MNTSSPKNAEYYLQRLQDLPQSFVQDARSLADEVGSRRILISSVAQVVTTLHLDLKKELYTKKPVEHLSTLIALLEHFGMKTAPCSVPADLDYEEPIYLTLKPDLSCDEDIATVAEIVKKRRTPSPRDYTHIQNTNEKMANYNVMLRVIEALFVICRENLNARQSAYLNELLSTLKLPAAGLAYLRNCFSYVSQYRCLSCDYTKEQYRYKSLDAEKTKRICLYLAKTAILADAQVAINPVFPQHDLLHSLYLQEKPPIALNSVIFQEQTTIRRTKASYSQKRTIISRLTSSSSENHPRVDESIGTDELVEILNSKTKLPAKLIEDFKPFLLDQGVDFSKAMEHVKQLAISPIQGSSIRSNTFLIHTAAFNTSIYWPFTPYLQTKLQEFLLKTQEGKPYLTALQKKKPQLLSHQADSIDTGSLLCWNFFATLILIPLCTELTSSYQSLVNEAFFETYQSASDEQKLNLERIYALHHLLFDKTNTSDDLKDDLLLQALGNSSELITLYLSTRASCEQSSDKFIRANLELFKLATFRLLLHPIAHRNVAMRRLRQRKHLNTQCLRRAISLIDDESILFNVSFSVDKPKLKNSGAQLKCLPPFLCGHVFLKPLLNCLLNSTILNSLTGFNFGINEAGCINSEAGKSIYAHTTELIYLSSLPPGAHDTLAALLAGECSIKDVEIIKAQLSGKKYHRLADLQNQMRFCASVDEDAMLCLEEGIKKCGLLSAPLEGMLPPILRREFQEFTLIEFPSSYVDNEVFLRKLGAAQLALITARMVFPSAQDAALLADCVCAEDPGRQACERFFKIIEDHARLLKPFSDSGFTKLYEILRSNEMFAPFGGYLKFLVKRAQSSVFSNYASQRYEKVLDLMHLRINNALESKSSKNTDKQALPTFNLKIIQSKIKESKEVESVITKLRDDESAQTTEPIDQSLDAKPAVTVPDLVDKTKAPEKSAMATGLSSNALSLIEAVSAQKIDAMGLDEFNGLCISLGFMSGDAAVEEINDYCYEHFDEPIFDSSPEEGLVYISLDLLVSLQE